MPKPAAQVLLERCREEVNNQGKLELIRELCTDPITRHDPGSVTVLSHDEQIERVRVITHADDTTGTSVWNMTTNKNNDTTKHNDTTEHNETKMCGIEGLNVENGVLVFGCRVSARAGDSPDYSSAACKRYLLAQVGCRSTAPKLQRLLGYLEESLRELG